MKKLSISFYLRASDLEELAELIGHQPACNKCVVQASCYDSYIDEYYDTIIDLKEPCEDAMEWFLKAEIIDDEIFEFLRKRDGSLLSSEDIITIIKCWGSRNTCLEEKTGIPSSTINRIGKYINKLNKYYCYTEEIVDEEIFLLKDKIEKALKYFKK